MTTPCQRWDRCRARYRPAGERIDAGRHGVELLTEAEARRFVVEQHYSGSYSGGSVPRRALPHPTRRTGRRRSGRGRRLQRAGGAGGAASVVWRRGQHLRRRAGPVRAARCRGGRWEVLVPGPRPPPARRRAPRGPGRPQLLRPDPPAPAGWLPAQAGARRRHLPGAQRTPRRPQQGPHPLPHPQRAGLLRPGLQQAPQREAGLAAMPPSSSGPPALPASRPARAAGPTGSASSAPATSGASGTPETSPTSGPSVTGDSAGELSEASRRPCPSRAGRRPVASWLSCDCARILQPR